MKGTKELLEKRNQEIIATYENDTQVTIQYLKDRFGLSPDYIRQILKKAGVILRADPTGRPSMLRLKPLSKGHIWLGHQIDIHLAKHGSVMDLSQKVRMSTHKLSLARFGAHDFTLSELQSLSRILHISLPRELVEGAPIIHRPEVQ